MKTTEIYNQLKYKYARKVKSFEYYLVKKGNEENTVRQHVNYTMLFLEWINKKHTRTEKVCYTDVLAFIAFCRAQKDNTGYINRKLLAIRKYYSFLQLTNETLKNPAAGLYLKGQKRKLPGNFLDKKQLQELYNNYPVYDLRTARNKTILSLLINQALTAGELRKLEPGHLNLRKGTIEIPGSRHSNGRILGLQPSQILEFKDYLEKIRPEILNALKLNPNWAGRKAENIDFRKLGRRLLPSMNGSDGIKNSLLHLVKALQKINPKVESCGQIRRSVITLWLKQEDVRKVQYKSGHRWVSTTERYQATNLESLQKALDKYHPLK